VSGRIAGLVLLALCELLAGLGLRNDALAARSRAEQYNRSWLDYQNCASHYRHLCKMLTTPEALLSRLDYMAEQFESAQQPEL
jgi:hypothetical protein